MSDMPASISTNQGAGFGKTDHKQRQSAEEACDRLKHKEGAAADLLKQLEEKAASRDLVSAIAEELNMTITYFHNEQARIKHHN